ncbi:thioredoxin family protein [Flavobacterium psychrophilum]|uniref:thioredoxin family protein n=1 Tax=Flavobacterium psychrophilum TaxID=96345 RepID=UPI0010699A17|nr:thioredoxin family protein [Flavobacterium psychrophilum]
MKTIIAQSLLKSIPYSEYRKRITELLLQNKSTGNEQSDDLLQYSKLNDNRMNRLDKTIRIEEKVLKSFNSLKKKYYWLVISESWCGDAAQLIPVFNKIANESESIELRLIFRDENEALMNLFLTNGSKSIPKIIILEKETMQLKGSWGPRPEGAVNLIKSYKEQYGIVDETAKTDLQLWYLHDKGLSTQNELATLMRDLEQLAN